jgi:uridylate kinase
MANAYKRILLKVSGEQLAGGSERGVDTKTINWLADEIKKVVDTGTQVVIVPGGGNWIRGADFAGEGIELTTAHYLGMMAGIINGQVLMDIFQSHGLPARAMSAVRMEQICEPYIRRKAIRHLEKGRVLLTTGGTGRAYVTHDSAAVLYSLELECDIVIKATNVDGVYDKDPHEYDDAKRLPEIGTQEALQNPDIKIFDKAAMGLALEQKRDILVYDVNVEDNLLKIVQGEKIGTLVKS